MLMLNRTLSLSRYQKSVCHPFLLALGIGYISYYIPFHSTVRAWSDICFATSCTYRDAASCFLWCFKALPIMPAAGFMWMGSILGSIFPLCTGSIQLLGKYPCEIGCIKVTVSCVSSIAGTEILNQLFIFFTVSPKRRHFKIISILVNCRLVCSVLCRVYILHFH